MPLETQRDQGGLPARCVLAIAKQILDSTTPCRQASRVNKLSLRQGTAPAVQSLVDAFSGGQEAGDEALSNHCTCL